MWFYALVKPDLVHNSHLAILSITFELIRCGHRWMVHGMLKLCGMTRTILVLVLFTHSPMSSTWKCEVQSRNLYMQFECK